jgi:hypothetical protein
MRVTAILLADHASVREGLLHVLGAGITKVARDPLPARLDVMLALMLRSDDLDDLKAAHNLEVGIAASGPSEEGATIAKAAMELSTVGPLHPGPNLQIPVVVPLQPVPVPATGLYRITVSLDGKEAGTYDFEVVKSMDASRE